MPKFIFRKDDTLRRLAVAAREGKIDLTSRKRDYQYRDLKIKGKVGDLGLRAREGCPSFALRGSFDPWWVPKPSSDGWRADLSLWPDNYHAAYSVEAWCKSPAGREIRRIVKEVERHRIAAERKPAIEAAERTRHELAEVRKRDHATVEATLSAL